LASTSVGLVSLATAVPPYVIEQSEVAARAKHFFGDRFPDFEKLFRVFENGSILRRYAVQPVDWYMADHGWPDRTSAYLETATDLFVTVARDAIEKASLEADDIDTVVTVSSTGIATPSLEARAAKRLGLSNVARVPVFGLGCAGGVTGLSLAARLARAEPGTNVLVVAVELCTLAIRLDKLTPGNIVALSLFGDGAAAAVVRADADGLAQINHAAEHTWPDTLDIMGWDVDPEGFGVIFDRSIPPFAAENLAPAVDRILQQQGMTSNKVGRFICHPGGRRVIEATEWALQLQRGELDHERQVLTEFGNMSAPTALFVLQRVLQMGMPDNSLLMALGPGFTLSTVTLGSRTS
jgi:alkylresorcinol/alkylpyrone synthase